MSQEPPTIPPSRRPCRKRLLKIFPLCILCCTDKCPVTKFLLPSFNQFKSCKKWLHGMVHKPLFQSQTKFTAKIALRDKARNLHISLDRFTFRGLAPWYLWVFFWRSWLGQIWNNEGSKNKNTFYLLLHIRGRCVRCIKVSEEVLRWFDADFALLLWTTHSITRQTILYLDLRIDEWIALDETYFCH